MLKANLWTGALELVFLGGESAGATAEANLKGLHPMRRKQGLAGFSQPDSNGEWRGIDVDLCRAVAAALLGEQLPRGGDRLSGSGFHREYDDQPDRPGHRRYRDHHARLSDDQPCHLRFHELVQPAFRAQRKRAMSQGIDETLCVLGRRPMVARPAFFHM